jgi:HK97 family phage major capsid protein
MPKEFTMSSALLEKRKEMDAKRQKVADIFAECKTSDNQYDLMKSKKLTGKDEPERAGEIRKMRLELEDLGKKFDEQMYIEQAAFDTNEEMKGLSEPAGNSFRFPEGGKKEFNCKPGQMFTDSHEFKGFKARKGDKLSLELDIPVKTLMTTSAGFAPESIRTGEVIEYPVQPNTVYDILPKGSTNQAAVIYMEQTTRTQSAAEKVEGTGTYGESAFVWTERSDTVQDIGHFIPVTTQQLEDVPQIQGIINDELGAGLFERVNYQAINGTGVSPYLLGILSKPGIQSKAHTGDRFDTIFKAAKDVRVTGCANPNVLVIHPNDWQDIRLARTEGGLYILGNPSETGPDRIWGMAKVESTAIAENTAIVGDFTARFIKLLEKRGVMIEITDSHDTYFIYGKWAIRATIRVVLQIKRAAAFLKITGI